MNVRRKWVWGALAGAMFLGIALSSLALGGNGGEETITVRFLNVGQGDAVLLSQGSFQVLIDGGRDPQLLAELLGRYMPLWDGTIEAVVATHPDEDHIGGLLGISGRYRVGALLETGIESKASFFSRWKSFAQSVQRIEVFSPLAMVFPNGARLETISPEEGGEHLENKSSSNDSGIVLRLVFGNHCFLFTGDISEDKESFLPAEEAEVLKVSHHGSKNSTSEAFLDRVRPKQVVISVGKNSYGHPSSELLERLQKKGVEILRTDESGTITFRCDRSDRRCEVGMEFAK